MVFLKKVRILQGTSLYKNEFNLYREALSKRGAFPKKYLQFFCVQRYKEVPMKDNKRVVNIACGLIWKGSRERRGEFAH